MSDKKILVISFHSLTANSAAAMGRLGFFVSKILHSHGVLDKFIVHSKGKFEAPFPTLPVSKWSRYYLFALNKLNKYLHFPPYKFRYWQEELYDMFCVQHVNSSVKILFTTHGHLRRTFKKAHDLGIEVIYVPANPEDNYIYRMVAEEKEKLNITSMDAYTYMPRLKLYNDAMANVDIVMPNYPPVYRSYKNSKEFKGKVIEHTGHLKTDFKPVEIDKKVNTGKTFTVGYLAHTVVLKGLHYLLEAWENIMKQEGKEHMQLKIAGKINDELKAYIDNRFAGIKNVSFTGHVADVPDYMLSLDMFAVPSLLEGGPYVALEAAHYGVPVLITDNAGSGELLSRNESGAWIVPIRDAKALEEKILWAEQHREEVAQMGINAKKNLDNYNMQEYIAEVAAFLEERLKAKN